ncbi:hypothetical protein RJT34_04419 [Clitoria ternatea]|uniref:BHLH domain-containing protein n=1 Tax=Clitoria ternatea TaxID=43366 RepID=A0AAN9KLZ6_CLITE
MENNPSSSGTERKIIERKRRSEMKALYSELSSVVLHQGSREANSLTDQIDNATKYIKNLQIRLEKMKEKKNSLIDFERSKNVSMIGLMSPQIKIQQTGSSLEIVLITGLDYLFLFNEIIRVIQEEGSEVVNASYTVVENAVFHTIHCQVEESANQAARISERLKFLYH